MAKKKKTGDGDLYQDGAAPSSMGPEPERAESGFTQRNTDEKGPAKKRLSFAVTDDGKVDWDSVRKKDELKESLKIAIIGDPEMIRALGLGSAQAGEISEENVHALINQFQIINRFIANFAVKAVTKGNSQGIDDDIAAQCFAFTKEQKDELAPRGARVANQYSTEWMKKYQDLILFFGMLCSYSSQQIQMAMVTQIMRDRVPRPNGHAAQQPLAGEDRVQA